MNVSAAAPGLRRITTLAGIIALCVVTLGAYVRLNEAGLACPDWPGCFGQLSVPTANEYYLDATQSAFPGVSLQWGKAWIEMVHRYSAATLGILIFVMFVFSWREHTAHTRMPVLPSLLLVLIIIQALFGMLTVTAQLKPVIVTLHLIGGMTTVAILAWLILQYSSRHSSAQRIATFGKKALAAVALACIFMQIALGGWTSSNSAGLICRDFPTCHGEWLPRMDFTDGFNIRRAASVAGQVDTPALTAIQWSHRIGALVTSIVLGGLFFATVRNQALRLLAFGMLGLLVIQLSLGISNVVLGTPLPLALLHNFCAASLLIVIVAINSRLWRDSVSVVRSEYCS